MATRANKHDPAAHFAARALAWQQWWQQLRDEATSEDEARPPSCEESDPSSRVAGGVAPAEQANAAPTEHQGLHAMNERPRAATEAAYRTAVKVSTRPAAHSLTKETRSDP